MTEPRSESATTAHRHRGDHAGATVVAGATAAVVVSAWVEVILRDRIGLWTGVTLLIVSVAGAMLTRAGDRSLTVMMPPLAFFAAAVIAGQALETTESGTWWIAQALMLFGVLGAGSVWVVSATSAAGLIALLRRRRDASVQPAA